MKNIFFAIKKITQVSKLVLPLLSIFILFSVFGVIAELFTIKIVIDYVLSEAFTMHAFIFYLFLYLIVMAVVKLFNEVILIMYIDKFEVQLKTYTMSEIYHKIPQIDMTNYNETGFYNKLNRALEESGSRYFVLLMQIFSLLVSLITFLFVFGFYNDVVILLSVAINVVSYIVFYFIENRRKYIFDKKEEPFYRFEDYMNRIFSRKEYALELRVSEGIKGKLLSKHSEQTKQYAANYKDFLKKSLRHGVLITTVGYLIYWLSSIYISSLLLGKNISVGDYLVLLNVVACMSTEMINALKSLPDIYHSSLYIEDIKEILNYPTDFTHNSPDDKIVPFESLIFENVFFRYCDNSEPVLRNLTFSIHRNEIIAVVGLNGVGKTTMIDCILGLLKPETGYVKLNGKRYSEYPSESLKKIFGIVFQDYQVYEISIAENILMHKMQSDSDAETVVEALKYIGLYEKVLLLPNGINTIISSDNNDANFSYGEKQKIAIARAYARKSPVLIFDEPASSLDVYAANHFYSQLLGLRKYQNKTVIFTTHKLCYAAYADKIFYMEEGTIKEIGNHEELLKLNQGYAALYGVQAKELFE